MVHSQWFFRQQIDVDIRNPSALLSSPNFTTLGQGDHVLGLSYLGQSKSEICLHACFILWVDNVF